VAGVDTSTLRRHYYYEDGVERGIEPISLEQMPSMAEVIRECRFYAVHLAQRRSG